MSTFGKTLKSYCQKHPAVQLVYLFGSTARGDRHAQSDTDLAFLFKKRLSLDEHAQLVVELKQLLKEKALDIVLLNDAPPVLKYDVVSEGKLLYQAISDDALNNFELKIIKEYFDTEPLRKVQDLYLKEKILGGARGL